MGLIVTKTFIYEDKFHCKEICGIDNQNLLSQTLLCTNQNEEVDDNEGEIEETFIEKMDENNEDEEVETEIPQFEISPLALDQKFFNEDKLELPLTKFSIKYDDYLKVSNFLKIFNSKRIILFEKDVVNKIYNEFTEDDQDEIRELVSNEIIIYFSDWLIDITYNYRQLFLENMPQMMQLPNEIKALFSKDNIIPDKLPPELDLKEVRSRFFLLLDVLIEKYNRENPDPDDEENADLQENMEPSYKKKKDKYKNNIIPLTYDFNLISQISSLYEMRLNLQIEEKRKEEEGEEGDDENQDESDNIEENFKILEHMDDENQDPNEGMDEEDKEYYQPDYIKILPVTFMDKLNELTGGNGLLVIIVGVCLILGLLIFLILPKKEKTNFSKPASYLFTMPNPGYPPTGYMYPPPGYYPNYPPKYP